jgi:hypothetical protein
MRWPTRDGGDQFVGVCGKDSWKRKEGAVWLEPRHADQNWQLKFWRRIWSSTGWPKYWLESVRQ